MEDNVFMDAIVQAKEMDGCQEAHDHEGREGGEGADAEILKRLPGFPEFVLPVIGPDHGQGLFPVTGIHQDMKEPSFFFDPGFNMLGGQNQEDQICFFCSQSVEQDFRILGHRALIFRANGLNTIQISLLHYIGLPGERKYANP